MTDNKFEDFDVESLEEDIQKTAEAATPAAQAAPVQTAPVQAAPAVNQAPPAAQTAPATNQVPPTNGAASAPAANKKKRKTKAFLETADVEILWKDRKRYLGMPISFTRYEVDQTRFTSRIGFFNTVTNETLLYRIMDLKLSRSLGQKIFGVGTITLYSADTSHNTFELKNIKKPEKVRRYLSNLVEKEREDRRLTGRELFGVADGGYDMPDLDGDGFPG